MVHAGLQLCAHIIALADVVACEYALGLGPKSGEFITRGTYWQVAVNAGYLQLLLKSNWSRAVGWSHFETMDSDLDIKYTFS